MTLISGSSTTHLISNLLLDGGTVALHASGQDLDISHAGSIHGFLVGLNCGHRDGIGAGPAEHCTTQGVGGGGSGQCRHMDDRSVRVVRQGLNNDDCRGQNKLPSMFLAKSAAVASIDGASFHK